MRREALAAMAVIALSCWAADAQDAKTILDNAARAMGATGLQSIQYSGSGYHFALGQSVNPNAPWPRFNLKSYTRVVHYDTVSSREELVRTQGENPPRGGGGQPLAGEQRQVLMVSGNHAWNMGGNTATPAPAAAGERLLQIWVTPHGLIKAALANPSTLKSQIVGGKKVTVVSFTGHGQFKVNGIINDQNLVERVETWIGHPVLGDMRLETTYSNYQDFNGVKFPTRIVQKQGDFPTLDLTVTEVQANAAAPIQVPDNVRQATAPPVRVDSQKVADGVWYLTGGSHYSVAVEFKDHVVVIEGPLNEERSTAVIQEVKKLTPGKPIKYLVNTHHHFDHSGGIRTYAAEGATIITHQINKPFYERAFRAPRTLSPDKLAQSKKNARFEAVTDRRVLSEGTRTMELHHVQGNTHNEGILMAYLPKEKLLIEADVYTPALPDAPPPVTANPFTVNLYDNLQRLKLDVNQITPIHGRLVTLADLLKAIGKMPSN